MEGNPRAFVSDNQRIAELSIIPVLVGVVLGIIFGASSLYLALKVGLTVSASIPIAVLSITLFRAFSKVFGMRRATILENNIVQTTGSAGESIAFGVAVTMPALMILGFDMELSRIMTVAILGGLLGVLMMIPLRYTLIVKEHETLRYPEGTACAEVLIAGEKGGTTAATVFLGFFVGLGYKFLNVGMKLWNDVPERLIGFLKGAYVSAEVSPELLGVGYIIGPRVAGTMVAGGILSSWALIPMIALFGGGLTEPLFPATKLISSMSPREIWKSYILYIGAGAVAAGGIISLIQSLPTIVRSAKQGLGGLASTGVGHGTKRTERDLDMRVVLGGSLLLLVAITLAPDLHLNAFGAVLIVIFGFIFSTVSSRLTGEIGSSSNPISGMTVATLVMTSLIFLALGWVSPLDRVTALSIAAVVCIASSNAGTISQDLKTGFLVGATPKSQQIAMLVGALTSAVVIGFTIELLNDASTIYSKKNVPTNVIVPDVASLTTKQRVKGPEGESDSNEYRVLQLPLPPKEGPLSALAPGKYLVDDTGVVRYFVDPGINGTLQARDNGTPVQKYDAPKARLMSLIIDGILTQRLPWALVLFGAAIAIAAHLTGIPTLAFAVGVYLPLSTSMPIFLGGMVSWLVGLVVRRRSGAKASAPEEDTGPGILFASGLIAGGAIAGVALAITLVKEDWANFLAFGSKIPAISGSDITSVIAFVVLMAWLFKVATSKKHAA